MPNTVPPVDGGSSAVAAVERARAIDTMDIVVAGTLTEGRAGKEMAGFDAMYEAGVRVFSDDGDAVPEAGLLRRIMAYLRDLPGALVAEHAEDRSIAGDGHMHEGMVSSGWGSPACPVSPRTSSSPGTSRSRPRPAPPSTSSMCRPPAPWS